MSLHPIRVKKHKRKSQTRYARFSGWHTDPNSINRPAWNPSTGQLKALAVLFLIIAGIFGADQVAKAFFPNSPLNPLQNYDPFTLLWNGTTTGSGTNVPGGSPIVFNSKVNASGAVPGGTPFNLPALTVTSTDTIVLAFQHNNVAFTISDSQSNTFSQRIMLSLDFNAIHDGAINIYTAIASSSGSDTISFTSGAVQSFDDAVALDYSGGIGFGNTASLLTTSSPANSGTNAISIASSSSSFIVQFIEAYTAGGSCPSPSMVITTASGQTQRNYRCGGLAVETTDITGLSGTNSLGFSWTNNVLNCDGFNGCIIGNIGLELTSSGGICPSGYGCVKSSVSAGHNIQLNANATSQAIALTNAPIDVSTSSSKELFFYETWHNATNLSVAKPFGWYLTTNSTLPTQTNYSPLNDTNVVLMIVIYPNAGDTSKNYYEYMAKTGGTAANPNQNLLGSSGAGTDPFPSCPQTATLYLCAGSQTSSGTQFQAASTTLNYTGNAGNTSNNGYSLLCVDGVPGSAPPSSNFCSSATQSPTLSPCTGTSQEICATTTLPFLNMQSGPFYLGFWSATGQSATIQFGSSNTGTASQRANSVWYWVPNPTVATPSTTDTGGFFGPLIKALLGIGIWIVSNILSFFPWLANVLGPLISTAFAILVPFIIGVLNAIGNALLLGNIGTDIQTLLTNAITFFSNQLPTAFSNFGTLFLRYFDFLTILFVWVPIALSLALNLLAIGINTISFIVTVVSDIFVLWNTVVVLMLILFFFADVGEYGLGGFMMFFEQFKFIVFGLGIGPLLDTIHYGTDIILLFVGILPKPIITMAAKFDTILPTVKISGNPSWPSFNMNELREGNYFSVLGFLIGMVVLVWFETTALPGSITALVPGVGTELTRDAPIVNLFLMMLEIFGFVALFVLPGQMMKGIGPITPGIGFDQLKFRRGPSVQAGSVSASFGIRGHREPGRILARAQRKLGETGTGKTNVKRFEKLGINKESNGNIN